MSERTKTVGVIGLLVLTLVVVGYALRNPGRDTSPATGKATVSAPAERAGRSTGTSTTRTAVFLGDSYAEGRGASAVDKRWTSVLSADMGWREVNLAHARTGYLKRGPNGSCGGVGCPGFRDLVDAVVATRPAVVVVAGGANDLGLDPAASAKAVSATIAGLRQGLPKGTIVVVNPWWDLRARDARLDRYARVIEQAARSEKAVWVDIGQPLSGHPDRMTPDGSQADDEGHGEIASLLRSALMSSGVSPSPVTSP